MSEVFQYDNITCSNNSCAITNAFCNHVAVVNLTAETDEFVQLLFNCFGPYWYNKTLTEDEERKKKPSAASGITNPLKRSWGTLLVLVLMIFTGLCGNSPV